MACWGLFLLSAAAVFCFCPAATKGWYRGLTRWPGAWGPFPQHINTGAPRQTHLHSSFLRASKLSTPHFTHLVSRHPSPGDPTPSLPAGVVEALPGVVTKVMEKYGPAHASAPAPAHPSTEPPVIWFPQQEEECPEVSGGGGFSPFGLLALLVAAANLLNLLASNANNNNNNNNNDNNLNSNLLQADNEVNNNNNANVYHAIVTGMGKRRRRSATGLCWAGQEVITGEEVVGVVGVAILRSYLQALLTKGQEDCVARSVCLAHAEAAEWGGLASVIAAGLSEAHVEWVTQVSSVVSRETLLAAAERGRQGESCVLLYPCPAGVWATLTQPHALVHALVSLAGPEDEEVS
ncbi:uncharacterized protein LOC135103443 [Scylla paramamosain]|uniref:uncharacterized protein LOC135103443 n=1 Tax=Scylla paramamosain TaxID=85552 RepID=UPI0030827E9D